MAENLIVGYRLSMGVKGFLYYSPENFSLASEVTEGMDSWALYKEPQPGCSKEIAVYLGDYWLEPKYVRSNHNLEKFIPLYIGPYISQLKTTEQFALSNPGFMETRLKHDKPELFKQVKK